MGSVTSLSNNTKRSSKDKKSTQDITLEEIEEQLKQNWEGKREFITKTGKKITLWKTGALLIKTINFVESPDEQFSLIDFLTKCSSNHNEKPSINSLNLPEKQDSSKHNEESSSEDLDQSNLPSTARRNRLMRSMYKYRDAM
jgi:hypothetical protein